MQNPYCHLFQHIHIKYLFYSRFYRRFWSESHSVMSDSLQPHGLYSPRNSPGQNTGVGSLSLLQQILTIQESNWGLLHCMQVLYQLSYEGSSFSKKYVFKKTQEKLTVYILNGFLYSYNFNALTLDIVDICL